MMRDDAKKLISLQDIQELRFAARDIFARTGDTTPTALVERLAEREREIQKAEKTKANSQEKTAESPEEKAADSSNELEIKIDLFVDARIRISPNPEDERWKLLNPCVALAFTDPSGAAAAVVVTNDPTGDWEHMLPQYVSLFIVSPQRIDELPAIDNKPPVAPEEGAVSAAGLESLHCRLQECDIGEVVDNTEEKDRAVSETQPLDKDWAKKMLADWLAAMNPSSQLTGTQTRAGSQKKKSRLWTLRKDKTANEIQESGKNAQAKEVVSLPPLPVRRIRLARVKIILDSIHLARYLNQRYVVLSRRIQGVLSGIEVAETHQSHIKKASAERAKSGKASLKALQPIVEAELEVALRNATAVNSRDRISFAEQEPPSLTKLLDRRIHKADLDKFTEQLEKFRGELLGVIQRTADRTKVDLVQPTIGSVEKMMSGAATKAQEPPPFEPVTARDLEAVQNDINSARKALEEKEYKYHSPSEWLKQFYNQLKSLPMAIAALAAVLILPLMDTVIGPTRAQSEIGSYLSNECSNPEEDVTVTECAAKEFASNHPVVGSEEIEERVKAIFTLLLHKFRTLRPSKSITVGI